MDYPVLEIGPREYRIELADLSSQGLDGVIYPAMRVIQIDSRLELSRAVDTTCHEAIHGCFKECGITAAAKLSDEQEELIVDLLTPAMLSLLRRNPGFARSLTDPGVWRLKSPRGGRKGGRKRDAEVVEGEGATTAEPDQARPRRAVEPAD